MKDGEPIALGDPVADAAYLQNHKALLTDAQVAEMRRRHAAGATAMELSKQYKIKYRHAWKIVNNKIRKNG